MTPRTRRWITLAALCTACTARSNGGGGFPLPDSGASEAALPDVVFHDVTLPDVALPTDAASPGVDTSPVIDAPPPVDTGPSYPPGPYGTSVGQRVQPFALTACNRSGADATWRFDQADFFANDVTVVLIVAGWSVPDQMLSRQLEAEIVRFYAGRRVRLVQVLTQDANRQPANASFCNTWVARYGLTLPVLVDPSNTLGVYNTRSVFPVTLVVDRNARLRALEYGVDQGLTGLRAQIEDVLANPDG
ncbi:MAG: hypothetical protein U0325_06125 [Polyangiales bacterium]